MDRAGAFNGAVSCLSLSNCCRKTQLLSHSFGLHFICVAVSLSCIKSPLQEFAAWAVYGYPASVCRAWRTPGSSHMQTAKLQQPQRQPWYRRVWLVPINTNYWCHIPPGARLMATTKQKDLQDTTELDMWVHISELLFATRDWLAGFGFHWCYLSPFLTLGTTPFWCATNHSATSPGTFIFPAGAEPEPDQQLLAPSTLKLTGNRSIRKGH